MSGAVKAVSKVVSAVIKPVSSLLGGLLGIKQPKMADASSEPGSQTLRSSKAPARYCLGRFSTGGVLAWGQEQAGSQTDNEWLHLVYVLSEGAIAGVDEIWLGEQQIGSYGSRASYEVVTDPDQVNAFLLANSPGWRSSQIGKGLSFVRISLRYSPEVFPSGIPDVRIVGRGRTDIYDPRTGNTGYSENAALLILWYLRNVLGVPDDEIVMPTFADAANVSAEAVTNPGGGSSTRYVIGAVIGDDEAPVSVLEKMCRACDGRLIRIGGRWTLQVGAYYGPYDFTITEDMIAGAVQGRTEVDNDKAINTIHGTFIDPSQSWTETDYPPVQVAEWVAVDGAELAEDLPLGYVNNPYQAQRLASIKLRRMRNGGELTLPMNAFGYNCRPGRVVRVQLPSLNIDGEFIVTDWAMGSDGGCNVSVAAYGPDIFDDAVGTPYNPLGFIQLPAGGMAPPTGLTFTPDESAEVLQGVLRWIPPYASVEYFGVIIRDSDGVAIQTYQVPGAAAQCQVAGLPSGNYTMSVFARGAMARSAEATISVSVMGPPAPLSVSTQESFDSITIIPFNPGGLNGGTYEYFYALTPVSNPESAIYLGHGATFVHNGLSYNTLYHYYVRSRNAYGVSQFVYVTASTVADPELILEIIAGQISETELGQHLRDEIELISGDGAGSVNDRIGDAVSQVDADLSDINGRVDDLRDDLQANVDGLNDAIEDVDSRLTGRIENFNTDLANLGNTISDLNDQVAGLDDDLQSSVSDLNQQLSALETQLADITGAEEWVPGQAYLAGSLVRFDGALYRAEQDVPAGTPVSNTAYWRKIGDYASLGEAVAALAIQVTDMQLTVDEISGEQAANVERLNILTAQVRGRRADGEKADALRGWETQASITERDRVEASDKEALAQRLLVIDAQIGDASAQLSTLQQAFSSESEATAGRLDQLAVELGTTSAELQQEIQTRATETAALAQDILDIQVELEGVATSAALQALTVRVNDLDGDITSVAQSVTNLTGRIAATESGLEAASTAISGLQTSVSEIEGELSAQASDITALGVSVGEARDLAEQADGKADDALAGLIDKADASAVQALTVEVNQLGDDVSSNTQSITQLGSSVTAAQDTADEALAGLAGKADSTAVQALTTEVEQLGDDLSAASQSITQLGGRLESAETSIAGNADAVEALSTELSLVDGKVEAAAEQASRLSAALRPNRADGEKADSLRGWQSQASITESSRVSASEREALAERLLVIDAQIGDASAQLSTLQQAFSSESEAVATQLDQLSAELGTTTADLQQEIQTRATETAALAQDILEIQVELEGVATSAALQALTVRVDDLDGAITSVAQSVTNLTGRIAATESGLEAASTAISGLQTSVSEIDGRVAAQAGDITALGVSIGEAADLAEQADGKADDALAGLGTKADASAVQALTTEVEEIDGRVSANSEMARRLAASVRPARADGDKADALRGYQSQASIAESRRATATEAEASAERDLLLQAELADTNAALLVEQQARATADSALAEEATSLRARIDSAEVTIGQVDTASVSRDEALGQRASTIEARMPAGSGELATSAAVQQVAQAVADESSARAQDISTVTAAVGAAQQTAEGAQDAADEALQGVAANAAAVQQANQAIADEASARASAIQTVQASVSAAQDTADQAAQEAGQATAAVQTVSQAVADLDGDLSAMWSVKMQVNQNGEYVYAGIGLGIENGPGGLQSQFLIEANRFALLNTINGETTAPFVVEGGQVFMNSAVIKQADIVNLIVTGVLQSSNYVAGQSGIRLNFVTGEFEMNGSVAGAGRTRITNQTYEVFDSNNVRRVRLGIW